MPWRRLRFGGYSPGCLIPYILFGLFIIQDISGHPIPCHDYHSYHNNDGVPYPYRGETCHDPRSFSHGIIAPTSPPVDHWNHPTSIVPEPRRVPKPTPVPIYYSVPIPWPTPSNGTNVTAPLPLPPSIDTYISPSLGQGSFPVYIPIPRFQYVPLYYDVTSGSPPSKPKGPEPKPKPPTKPDKPSKPLTKPPQGPKKPPPQETKTPLNPICEESRPLVQPSPKITPPPHHTWIPPPKNLPSYIPPSPSDVHPRSPNYPTNRPVDPYPNYGHNYPPDSYSQPYYQITNPYGYHYDYVTQGRRMVTITDPRTGDGYITTGPDTITFSDRYPSWSPPIYDWQIPPPPPPPHPRFPPISPQPTDIGSRSSIPSPPEKKPEIDIGYVFYDPEIYTIKEGDADADKAIVFGPNVVDVIEQNSFDDKPKDKPPAGYDEPEIINFPEPDTDFRYAPENGAILEEPAPSAYASLLPGGNKGLSSAPSR